MSFLPKVLVGYGLNSRGRWGKVADDDGTTVVTDADANGGDEDHHVKSQPQLMLIAIIWDHSPICSQWRPYISGGEMGEGKG